jgi:hypothetical protein
VFLGIGIVEKHASLERLLSVIEPMELYIRAIELLRQRASLYPDGFRGVSLSLHGKPPTLNVDLFLPVRYLLG